MRLIAAQGEVNIFKLDSKPKGEMKLVKANNKGEYIIAHSEQGHHHMISGGNVYDMGVIGEGMQTYFVELEKPEKLYQDASVPHEEHLLDAGYYEIRNAREYNPFADQVRAVLD